MVPITEDWIRSLLGLGECLNTTALRHDIDMLDIKLEPEFGYIHIKGSRTNEKGDRVEEIFQATQWRDFEAKIKIAPQGAATPTGASK